MASNARANGTTLKALAWWTSTDDSEKQGMPGLAPDSPPNNHTPPGVSGQGHEMDAQPDFDEALRRQRDVFRDRYEANDSLRSEERRVGKEGRYRWTMYNS